MRLLVLPGDGIGPEITRAAIGVLDAANRRFGLDLAYEYEDIGFASLKKYGTTLRDSVLETARTVEGIILGPQSNWEYPPVEKGGINVSAGFRVKLDLYANIRPARSRPFLARGANGMDLVIVREGTEGFYSDRNMFAGSGEFMPTPDVAVSLRKITAFACERIARRALELAMKRRKKLTAVHKANVFALTDGLFMRQVREAAASFPQVQLDEVLVDAMAAHLVRDSSRFDVIVTTNLYGDILSDLASELSGSLGLAASILAGDNLAAAQAQHGSAPDLQGKDLANPSSLILSAGMLLNWIGERKRDSKFVEAGSAVEAAVDRVLAEPSSRTRDLGGSLGTDAFGSLVARAVMS